MIVLHLAARVPEGGRADLEAFLAQARVFYEAPGGIRVRLQWDRDDPRAFVEIMEYADEAAYLADAARVESDPEMRAWLARWHGLLEGPVTVTTYDDVPLA